MNSSQSELTREQFEPGLRHIRDILPSVLAAYVAIEEESAAADDFAIWTPWTGDTQRGELLTAQR